VKVNAPIAVLLEEGESADDIGSAPSEAPKEALASDRSGPRRGTLTRQRLRQAMDVVRPRLQRHRPRPQPLMASRIFASPLARRIAKDKGLDLSARSKVRDRMAAS
jgi:pyruvate dehydrogenase E2 component (dihydrolipoamide acetyltransferase)